MLTKQWLFIILTLGFIPIAVWAAMTWRLVERMLVVGTFLSTAYLIDINFVSMELYRGDTRGFEFGVTDWMSISLLLVMKFSRRWRGKRPSLYPPYSSLIFFYFALAFLSLLFAYQTLYAGFGLFKLLRIFVVYIVAYNYLRCEKDLVFVVFILVAMVSLEFSLVIWQRLHGLYRAVGSTPHSNTLAVYVNMLNMIFFAFILQGNKRLVGFCWLGLCMGSLCVLASFSRGALAAMAIGYSLVALLSLYEHFHVRKIKVMAGLLVAALLLSMKVGPALLDRFINAPAASGHSRELANTAALAMANDHIFGVGINNYSYVINDTQYQRFIDDPVDRGIVHNIYLLHASEMGWLGLFSFLLMILLFFKPAIVQIRKHRNNCTSAYAIGLLVAMLSLWLQSGLEWLFRQTYICVEYFVLVGFLVALPKIDAALIKQQRVKKWLSSKLNQESQLSCAHTTTAPSSVKL